MTFHACDKQHAQIGLRVWSHASNEKACKGWSFGNMGSHYATHYNYRCLELNPFNFVIKWKVHKTFTVFSGQLPAQCITCTGTKMLIFRKQLLYYPQRQITCIIHRTKTVVGTILYASVLGKSLLACDHAIFTRKMAAELILIAHFTNLILGTKSRWKDKRGKVYVAPVIWFFSIFIMSHLP